MKLTTVTHVSLDGVMQGLGGRDEDPRDGFERGGWALPLLDAEGGRLINGLFQRADAFLFGRWTYETFANYWGAISDPDNPIASSLNAKPKYVVSTTLVDAKWSDTTVLTGNVAATIADLKSTGSGELQVHGSGTLVRSLLENRLIDEITLLTYPLIVGQGRRLFSEAGPDVALDLVDSGAITSGVLLQVYRPTGSPTYV
jgi:dihydrofolate reductase